MHAIQRGHNREACFREHGDRAVYLSHLRELSTDLQCPLHAYCLMTNHVHLLVTPSRHDSLATLMRCPGQRYVQYFNRHHQRSGTLWEGRFRSCLTESRRYVLACYRYIEMNPVRAGMVSAPGEYRWSSHLANIGLSGDALLNPHGEFLALGRDAESRRRAYQELFLRDDATEADAIREATNGGYPLVGQRLKEDLEAEGHRLGPGPSGRPRKAVLEAG